MPRKSVKPRCPADTPKPVKDEFARLVRLMGDRAIDADELTLLMLATSWITWRDARRQVQQDGTVVMSGGTAIAHPALAVAHQAHTQILALCKELGLTAASRRKLVDAEDDAPPEPQTWDDLDDEEEDGQA